MPCRSRGCSTRPSRLAGISDAAVPGCSFATDCRSAASTSGRSSAAWTREIAHDRALHARLEHPAHCRREPARPPHAAAARHAESPGAGRIVRRPAPSIAGGRGYFPRSRGCMAPRQSRPCQPRPTQSHVSHRELPHSSARRPCRALARTRLRPQASPITAALCALPVMGS